MRSVSGRVLTVSTLALLFIAIGLCGALNVNAQVNLGRISGTVKDASGSVIPGATVTAANEATTIIRTATTDKTGFYLVTNLATGDYTFQIDHLEFRKVKKTGTNLVSDGRLTVDFVLEPAGISDSVSVTSASGETINTTSGEIARVIDGDQIQELTLNGRNYMELTTLIPGAPSLNDDVFELMTGLGVTQPINGGRGNNNLLTIDGGFNLDSGSNGSQITNIGTDFIQEVKIQTSNFSAEYGRNSGASINVSTKSGTNKFRGSLFEFVRNDKLDANRFFSNRSGAERRPLRFNDYGFSIGGPIVKNKLFFFGGIEWKRIRRFDEFSRTIPTQAEREGDFSFRLRGPDGIVGTNDDGVLRDPTISGTCTAANRTACFGGNNVALRNKIPA